MHCRLWPLFRILNNIHAANLDILASKFTISVIIPLLLSSVTAAPHADHQARVAGQTSWHELDRAGMLDWEELESGDQFTHIPPEMMGELEKRQLAGLRNKFDVSNVLGKVTEAACLGSGKVMATDIIRDEAAAACKELVSRSAQGQAVDAGWNVVRRLGIVDQANRMADLSFLW